ncbi:hypothetical protein PYW08_006429 [Mythimna loreyi]|uniref:Uncharacterized protein n=1 Tax=Mythimna loreyi TaxID=667449 RepID=A0ACC2QPM3_9NEOP|nr:hypothetical protein PYW08_006429 [Mythimna loreyi]
MWARIYPHVALLILANIILKASCKGSGSLTFVIDNTYSMRDDIAQVRRNVDWISNVVFNDEASQIENMVLVTFNDPGAKFWGVTKDRNTFKRNLNAIEVHGGGDCWEPSMKGLLLGLEKSNSHSYIFVFTDAPAKDHWKSHFVKEMCQKKQTRILPIIGETIKGKQTVITTASLPALPGVIRVIPFTIDDQTDYAIVSVSGRKVDLHIRGPRHNTEIIMSTYNGKVVKLSNVTPGKYEATVKSDSKMSVVIVGRTDFFFSHGFSELKPNSLGDTSLQPLAESKVHLSISVTDEYRSVQIESAQILDMSEKPINIPMPLTETSKNFYVTDLFVAPSQRFKVAVNGKIKATGKSIRRIGKIPITPKDYAPVIVTNSTTVEGIEGDVALRIPCKAVGVPKPVITWKHKGATIKANAKYDLDDGTLVIMKPTEKDTSSYTCEAKNHISSDSVTFQVKVYNAPKIVTNSTTVEGIEGDVALRIPCKAVGVPKPVITWKHKGATIKANAKYDLDDGTLVIMKPTEKDTSSYTCEAKNHISSDSVTFQVKVYNAPKIVTNSTTVEGIEGDVALRIPCKAVGVPKPVITWKHKGATIKANAKYDLDDGTLVIMKPTEKDTSSYTCEAKNHISSDSVTFQVKVYNAPKIVTNSTTVEGIEGDVALRIPCKAVGVPKPVITWKHKGATIKANAKYDLDDGTLVIMKPTEKDTSSYTCEAKNHISSDSVTFQVKVYNAPKIVTNSTTVEGIEGDVALRIPCKAVGVPKPVITWKHKGATIKANAKYDLDDGTLVIMKPTEKDTSSYTCEAKNHISSDSVTFQVKVYNAPKIVTNSTTVEGIEGDVALRIPCKAVGVPKPVITWKHKGATIKANAKYDLDDGTLVIMKPTEKDTSSYTCEAKNHISSDSVTFQVKVYNAPKIVTNSTTVEGIEGDVALRIPCKAVGVPKPVITWKHKGATIKANVKYTLEDGTLVIMKPTEKDTSSYTCEAKNHISSDSVTFQVKVYKYLKSSGTLHYVYLNENETKKLECEAYNSKSQSVKWFITLDAGNKEYIQITNASSFDHDGNYTCHVSDKHGNTQTHTYVVDVGVAPVFISNTESITHWKGDVNEISQICDVYHTKPKPDVQWKYNDKVITDLSLVGVGHYTCNISNVHGSVFKQFDVETSECLIRRNLNDAPYMPLLLNEEGSWHKLESTKHYMRVEHKMKMTLSCPSWKDTPNSFKTFPKNSTLEAICYKEDSFIVNDKTYKLSDLQCTNSIEPSLIKKKTKCSTETSELISVGYNVPAFLEAYEVCFDHKSNMPSYTRIVMNETNDNGANGGYNWYTYPGIGSDKTERGFTCKDASSSCCYSKSQLVNAIDFNDGPAKKSTFIDPLNVVPVWIPCDTSKSSWKDINDMVRLPIYTDVVVWSGTHTLQEKNGAVIPRYLWKVVQLNDTMAIVHVNDPNPTKSDIKCNTPDFCDKYKDWFKSDDSTYCCSLPDFLQSFDFHGTVIGETLEAEVYSGPVEY